MACLKMFTDGASRGNPGEAGIGVIIYDQTNQAVLELGEYIGQTTNNIAEYKALIRALEEAKALGGTEVEVYADSELMVKQVNGQYKVKNEGLIPLHREVMGLARGFDKFKLGHVLRTSNKEADKMANAGIDAKSKVEKRHGGTAVEPVVTSSVSTGSPESLFAEGSKNPLIKNYAGEFPTVEVLPGITRRVLATSSQLMTVEFRYKKGIIVPGHKHPHEQACFIYKGKVKYTVKGREIILNEGESLVIPGNEEHVTEVLEDTIDINTFTPPRDDYLKITSKSSLLFGI